MIKSFKKTNLPKNTIEYEVTIDKETIKKSYELIFHEKQKNLIIPGFRKGKVPADIAKKNIPQDEVFQEVIKKIIPEIYQELILKEKIQPFASPKIDLIKAKEEEEWVIKFTIPLKPIITLPKYQEIVQNLKKNLKSKDIWVPGKIKDKSTTEEEEQKRSELINQIFNELISQSKIEISDLIIEEELERRLTQLVDDIRKIGLTVEAYLKSKNETIQSIKERFKKEIINTYLLDFALEEIADKEKIVVDPEELDNIFSHIKDEKQKAEAKKNSYFYAALLRRQKTIDFLINL